MLCFANSGVATLSLLVVFAHPQSEPLDHFWETGGLATGPTPLTATRLRCNEAEESPVTHRIVRRTS